MPPATRATRPGWAKCNKGGGGNVPAPGPCAATGRWRRARSRAVAGERCGRRPAASRGRRAGAAPGRGDDGGAGLMDLHRGMSWRLLLANIVGALLVLAGIGLEALNAGSLIAFRNAATRHGGEVIELGSYAQSEERRVGKECRSRWSPYH